MVEVTKGPRINLLNKIRTFEFDYAPRIKEQLEKHKVVHSESHANEWAIGLWVFAPQTTLTNLESRIQAAGVENLQSYCFGGHDYPATMGIFVSAEFHNLGLPSLC